MPAAMVKPVGGRVVQRVGHARAAGGRGASAGSIAPSAASSRGQRSMTPRKRSSDARQCAARSGAELAASRKRARVDFLDCQRVERAREVGGEAHRFGGAFVGTAKQAGKAQLPLERIDRRRYAARRGRAGRARRRCGRRARDRRSRSGAAGPARRRWRARTPRSAVRTARLLGSRMRPRGKRQRLAAVAADQRRRRARRRRLRCAGMVKTVGRGRGPLSHAAERRLGRGDRRRACRRRTTAPGGPRRSSGLPRSPGPTRYWSRKARPGASRSSRFETIWMPVKTNGATRPCPAPPEAARRGPCGSRPCPRLLRARACGTSSSSASISLVVPVRGEQAQRSPRGRRPKNCRC